MFHICKYTNTNMNGYDKEYVTNPFRDELPVPDTYIIVIQQPVQALTKYAETTDLVVEGMAICCITLLIQRYCSLCFIGWNVARILQ